MVTSGPGTGQPTVTLTYSYDPSGDVTSMTDSLSGSGATGQGITTYVYDNALRLTTITQSIGGTAGPEVTIDATTRRARSPSWTRDDRHDGTIVTTTSIAYDAAKNLTEIDTTRRRR